MNKRSILLAGAIWLSAISFPAPAWAHPHLRKSSPAGGSVLVRPPGKLTLVFSERVETDLTRAVLVHSSGDSVALAGFHAIPGEPLAAEAEFTSALKPGRHTVVWTCMGVDGHGMKGQFTFEIADSSVRADTATNFVANSSSASEPPGPKQVDSQSEGMGGNSGGIAGAFARFATFTGILLLLGAAAFRFLVLPRPQLSAVFREEAIHRILKIALVGAGVLLCFAVARVFLQSSNMSSTPGAATMSPLSVLTGTRWGREMQLLIAASLIALVSLAFGRRSTAAWLIAAVSGLAATVAIAVSGHAGSVDRFPQAAIAADVLHIVAVSCWIGSLISLLVAALPLAFRKENAGGWESIAQMVRAFSLVAMTSMVIIIATGVFSAWMQLGEFGNLFTTTYGKVLLLKIGLFSMTAVIGAYNFRIVTPKLGTQDGTSRLVQSARAEVAVAALILAVTGFLTGLSAT